MQQTGFQPSPVTWWPRPCWHLWRLRSNTIQKAQELGSSLELYRLNVGKRMHSFHILHLVWVGKPGHKIIPTCGNQGLGTDYQSCWEGSRERSSSGLNRPPPSLLSVLRRSWDIADTWLREKVWYTALIFTDREKTQLTVMKIMCKSEKAEKKVEDNQDSNQPLGASIDPLLSCLCLF